MKERYKELVIKAFEAKKYAYVPYSKFKVGAAVLSKSGKIFSGCNIENATYGATNCAERTAIFKAVSEGELEFEAIAVAGDSKENYTAPCGICRQVILEFSENIKVILAKTPDDYKVFNIKDILPYAFSKKDLNL